MDVSDMYGPGGEFVDRGQSFPDSRQSHGQSGLHPVVGMLTGLIQTQHQPLICINECVYTHFSVLFSHILSLVRSCGLY